MKIFYICGLSCYPSFDGYWTEENAETRFGRYIPTVGLILVITVATITATTSQLLIGLQDEWATYDRAMMFSLTMMLSLVPCAIQMVYLWSYFAKIWTHIDIIERSWWREMSTVSTTLQRHFMRRVYVMIVLFLMKIAVSLCGRDINLTTIFITIGLHTLRAVTMLFVLQAYFYIDLLDHLLQGFVKQVDSRATTVTAVSAWNLKCLRTPVTYQLRAEIMHFKSIHFRLWTISEQINHLFGGVIIIIFLQYFAFSVYSVYVAYKALVGTQWDLFKFMREYILAMLEWSVSTNCFICFAGPTFSLIGYAINVTLIANSCHRCSAWVMSLCFVL